jgi:hypothetical protein
MDLSIIIPGDFNSKPALQHTCTLLEVMLDKVAIGYEIQFYLRGQHKYGPCVEVYIDNYQTLSIKQINGLVRAIDFIKSLQNNNHETLYSLYLPS